MTLASETTTTTATTTATATATTVQLRLPDGWFTVCDLAVLMPGRGVAALLPDGHQVALFLDRTGRMYAIDNRDPFSGAAVLSAASRAPTRAARSSPHRSSSSASTWSRGSAWTTRR